MRLLGPTCYEADLIGDLYLERLPEVGEPLILGNVSTYSAA